uniref:MAM domain-containing protein n=1 Tax=Syphacia muris TaxID=451379 RepID=A0A0N5A9P6_9BILA
MLKQIEYVLVILGILSLETVCRTTTGSVPSNSNSVNGFGNFGDANSLLHLKKILGGNVEIDLLWFPIIKWPSIFGQAKIQYPRDLCCNDFDALLTRNCRWRNEWTACGIGDEFDWIRGKNRWGLNEGLTVFGTEETASGYFIMTGTIKKSHPDFSAMLVSDPIQCQEGELVTAHRDGNLMFKYWTSPSVKVRACIRRPGNGKAYDWCSDDFVIDDPGPANITIPGSILYTFEIIIEARNFIYDAFGIQGGLCIIDDIAYNAKAIYNCVLEPHIKPVINLPEKTCKLLHCTFQNEECFKAVTSSGWKVTDKPVGNYHTGIRRPLESNYAYAQGSGTRVFSLGKFTINREAQLEFCYYRSSWKTKLAIFTTQNDGENRTIIYESYPLEAYPHKWICDGVRLEIGSYDSIEFQGEKLLNEHSYLAIDQIGLADPLRGTKICIKQKSKTM